jgi:hypothetical protein
VVLETDDTSTDSAPDTGADAAPEPAAAPASLRETLASTFEAMSNGEDGSQAAGNGPPSDEDGAEGAKPTPKAKAPLAAAKATGKGRDASGRFTKPDAKGVPKPVAAAKTVDPQAAKPAIDPADPAADEPEGKPTPVLKPPASWKATAKASWDKLPPEAKAEVTRREREMQHALEETAGERKLASAFREVMSPFENHLRARGHEPLQVVSNMMRVGYALENGTSKERARVLAHLFQASGANLEDLAEAIDGAPNTGAARAPASLDPVALKQSVKQELRQEMLGERQTALAAKAKAEVAAFAESHEHFEQVRERMKALQLAHAQMGQRLSLDDAYTMAMKLDPELSQLAEREAAIARAETASAATRKAKAAATVRSKPAVAGKGEPPKDLRSALRASWAELTGQQS